MERIGNTQELPFMMSAKDAQSLLGLSRSMVYNLLNREDVGVICIGRRKFFRRDALLEWLGRQTLAAKEA